jgi:hypothetical protein
MPNIPPRHDPNRPTPRTSQGARAEPDSPPQRRAQANDETQRTRTAKRQDESRGGLGTRARGGYAEHVPTPRRPRTR